MGLFGWDRLALNRWWWWVWLWEREVCLVALIQGLLLFKVCLVGFDLLLIDGDDGFDCENVNFARYINCEDVKFYSGFSLVLGFGKNMKNKFLCFGLLLLLMLDDIDVLLLIWLGFDLLVLEICLGWNSMYLGEFVLREMLEKKIFEHYVLRFCDLGLCSCNTLPSKCKVVTDPYSFIESLIPLLERISRYI